MFNFDIVKEIILTSSYRETGEILLLAVTGQYILNFQTCLIYKITTIVVYVLDIIEILAFSS